MSRDISNSDDIIDSLDVIERIEELQTSIGIDIANVYEERLDALKEEAQALRSDLEDLHTAYLNDCYKLQGGLLSGLPVDEWADTVAADVMWFDQWCEEGASPGNGRDRYMRMAERIDDWEVPDAPETVKEAVLLRDDLEDHDELEELIVLLKLQEEAQPYCPDWSYGATLINRSYFVEYCEELCKDVGDLPANIPDYLVIDWEATANNLEADYTTVDYGGEEYLIR